MKTLSYILFLGLLACSQPEVQGEQGTTVSEQAHGTDETTEAGNEPQATTVELRNEAGKKYNPYAIDLEIPQLRLNGLKFGAEKEAIVQKFGDPVSVTEPKYECGYYSEAEQGKRFYLLDYPHLKFIGNEQDKYTFDIAHFNADSGLTLEYGDNKFNYKTTLSDFYQVFGDAVKDHVRTGEGDKSSITLFSKATDSAIIFEFKAGYLVRIEHWTPC